MDEKEHDEILYRLDERTKRVDDHLNRLDKQVKANAEMLEAHEGRITENETFLGNIWMATKAIGAVLVSLISGLGASIAGVLP